MNRDTGLSGVHPTSVVCAGAQIGEGVSIGPYAVVGGAVVVGDGARVGAHVHLAGITRLGARVQIFPFASVGEAPQHLQYRGEATELEIGDDTVIREHVTVNTGTVQGRGITRIGSRCLLMIGSHVAHDCQVGDQVVISQASILGGHVTVGDHTVLGAHSGIHQFCRVGKFAMVGAKCGVFDDLIPFGLCVGHHASLAGINVIGLRRRGCSRFVIRALQAAHDRIFEKNGTLLARARGVLNEPDVIAEVRDLAEFIVDRGKRPTMCPSRP